MQPGYAYRKDSTVEVKIDGRSFQLFTQGEHAWTRTDDDDRALIEAMKRGGHHDRARHLDPRHLLARHLLA